MIMARMPFNVQDHHLWDDIRNSVRPLRSRPVLTSSRAVPTKMPDKTLERTEPSRVQMRTAPSSHAPAPLASFDRRTAQKLSRGQLEPDARIDLHGETVSASRGRLYHFLLQRQRSGDRLVLVITGKGASPFSGHMLHGHRIIDSPERQGKLRRELPLWLQEDVFRALVIGVQPAHPRHGGGGAFYVRLRRVPGHDHDVGYGAGS
jgi:DNA-nicking Smr family endonuclease